MPTPLLGVVYLNESKLIDLSDLDKKLSRINYDVEGREIPYTVSNVSFAYSARG